jgi:K+-transporting ATPase ATPase B chain
MKARKSTFDPKLVRRAVADAFTKLDPRTMARNPVMFLVAAGAVLTTLLLFRTFTGFQLQIALWLWATVLFANFAEAIAEGRGKAQAETLRKTKTETMAPATRGASPRIDVAKR